MVCQAVFRRTTSFVLHNNSLNLRPLMWARISCYHRWTERKAKGESEEARNVNQPAYSRARETL